MNGESTQHVINRYWRGSNKYGSQKDRKEKCSEEIRNEQRSKYTCDECGIVRERWWSCGCVDVCDLVYVAVNRMNRSRNSLIFIFFFISVFGRLSDVHSPGFLIYLMSQRHNQDSEWELSFERYHSMSFCLKKPVHDILYLYTIIDLRKCRAYTPILLMYAAQFDRTVTTGWYTITAAGAHFSTMPMSSFTSIGRWCWSWDFIIAPACQEKFSLLPGYRDNYQGLLSESRNRRQDAKLPGIPSSSVSAEMSGPCLSFRNNQFTKEMHSRCHFPTHKHQGQCRMLFYCFPECVYVILEMAVRVVVIP